MMRRWRCALVVFGLVSGIAHAQNDAPKTFYKKDYAIAPGAEGGEYTLPQPSAPQKKGKGTPAQESNPQAPQQKTTPAAKKRRIVMTVYVSSADKDHLSKVLEEVYAVNDERTAFIISLNHIGDYRNITPEMESELSKRHIQLLAAAEPPSAAQVTVSPTWIIQTQKGTHIAEGVIPIHLYFDEFGEYDPQRRNDSNPKTSVEGF